MGTYDNLEEWMAKSMGPSVGAPSSTYRDTVRSELATLLANAEGAQFSVVAYGAKGDGTTDDTAAIQAAVTAAASGGTVTFPKGTYAMSAAVNLSNPMRLIGEPGSVLKVSASPLKILSSDIRLEGLTVKSHDGSQKLLFYSLIPAASKKDNTGLTIVDCKFDGVIVRVSPCSYTDSNGTAIVVGEDIASGIKIERCKFVDVLAAYTVDLKAVSNVTVRGCHIKDCGIDVDAGDGIKTSAGCRDVLIDGNYIEGVTRDGMDLWDSTRITVVNNSILNVGAQGIDTKWGDAADENGCQYMIIANNRVDGAGQDASGTGIDVSINNSVCVGNYVENSDNGIRVNQSFDAETTTQVSVVGNVCRANGYNFYINADDVAVLGNISVDPVTSGYVLYGDQVLCSGNTGFDDKIQATGAGTVGIQVVTLQDAKAGNNNIYYSSDQSALCYKDSSGTVVTIDTTAIA